MFMYPSSAKFLRTIVRWFYPDLGTCKFEILTVFWQKLIYMICAVYKVPFSTMHCNGVRTVGSLVTLYSSEL